MAKGKKLIEEAAEALGVKSKRAAKANATKAAKKTAADKAADAVKAKGRVSTAKVADFIEKHGEKAAAKNFSKMQVSRAKKRVAQNKRAAINKSVSDPIKTPTGTRRARKRPVAEQSKSSMREELIEGARKRPQNATTTVIGATPGRPRARVNPKKFRAARKETERREPASEFESRLNREALQGGVENLGQRGRGINEGPKDTGYTREQVSDEMREQTISRKEMEQEEGRKRLEREADRILSKGKTKKKYGGKISKKSSGGSVKSHRGMGKALRGGRTPKFR